MYKADLLSGRGILITGGGSGLGLAVAERCAELGANVAICGRTKEKLDAAAERIRTHGGKVFTRATDVRDYEEVEKLIAETADALGSLDGLVNNAAGNFYSASEDLTPNGFKTIIDIVLHGTFNCTQHFGRHLIESNKPGSVVSIVTTYTETGSAFVLPSACSKAGVYALTNSLAYEWAEYGIRLNSIAPGPIPTEGAWKRLFPDKSFEETYRKRLPSKRFGKPEELTNLAAFLLSDLSSYMTGACVTMDGGERLQGGEFNFLSELMPREKLKETFAAMRPKK